MKKIYVPVEISARHIHLSIKDAKKLFGNKYKFIIKNDISMKGQFSTTQTLAVIGSKRKFDKVRIVGPERPGSQLELSASDCYFLGVKTFYKVSGQTKGAPLVMVVGPRGKVKIPVIVPIRHIHISDKLASKHGLKNKQKVNVKISGKRSLVFEKVIVRIHPTFRFRLHLDTDEGNAAGIVSGQKAIIIK